VSPFFDEAAYAVLYRSDRELARVAGTVRGVLRRLRDFARAGRFDLVLVYRESAPIGPPVFERLLIRKGKSYVYDFDDALFVGPVHPSNRRWSWLRAPARYGEIVRGARTVIAANEYLGAWARGLGAEVTIIPTPVDTTRFVPGRRRSGSPFVIGWIGSSTTAPYLRLLDEVLDRLVGRIDFVLRVVGGTYAHPRAPVEVIPWSLAREPDDVAGFDIGVLPEPDDVWTRGKGAFKAILYMAVGLPVVASTVGVNPEVIPEGRVGFCVQSADEWVAAIERLAGDPDLRARLGATGRRWVEERYSLKALAPRMATVLRSAAGSGA